MFNTKLSFTIVIYHAFAECKKSVFFPRFDKSGRHVTCTWLIKNSLSEETEDETTQHEKKVFKVDYQSVLRTFIILIAFSIYV